MQSRGGEKSGKNVGVFGDVGPLAVKRGAWWCEAKHVCKKKKRSDGVRKKLGTFLAGRDLKVSALTQHL